MTRSGHERPGARITRRRFLALSSAAAVAGALLPAVAGSPGGDARITALFRRWVSAQGTLSALLDRGGDAAALDLCARLATAALSVPADGADGMAVKLYLLAWQRYGAAGGDTPFAIAADPDDDDAPAILSLLADAARLSPTVGRVMAAATPANAVRGDA